MGKTVERQMAASRRNRRGMLMATTAVMALMSAPALAVDGQWLANPVSGSWNSGLNWSSNPSVPDGAITFGNSTETTIGVNGIHTLDSITFGNPSDAFTINLNASARFSFEGDGIVNDGIETQTFNTNNSSTSIRFFNDSTAGTNTEFNINSGGIYFFNNSSAAGSSITSTDLIHFGFTATAGNATIVNDAFGSLLFYDETSAGASTITNNSYMAASGTVTLGTATIGNAAQMDLSEEATAGSASLTLLNDSITTFRDDATAGTSTISAEAGSALNFRNNATAASSGIDNSGEVNFEDDSTAGGATITVQNGGSVQFFDDATGGTAQIDILNGAVSFDHTSNAGAATIYNDYDLNFLTESSAGSATITNDVEGVVRFGSDSTAASSEIGNSGEVNFEDDSTAGGATITTRNGGALNFIANAIAGTAGLIFEHGATGVFDDNSSAENAVVDVQGDGVDYAELYFRGNASAGAATIEVGGYIDFEDNSTAGTAEITNTADGSTRFYNSSTAGGASFINNGGLAFTDDSSADEASIENNEVLTFSGSASGGTAVIVNNNMAEFTQSSTAGSAEIENEGDLFFRDTASAGDAVITTTNGGTVDFRNAATGGTAQFIVEAGGIFTTENLVAASLEVGSIAGAGDFTLGLGKELVVGGNDLSTEVSGVISGIGGSLTKTGTGILILSGINTLTGGTSVQGGMLVVNGVLPDVSVSGGGTLGGSGPVTGSINTLIGGIIAPGNSIGTLQADNVAFAAGSFFDVEVDDAGNSDLLQVDNEATINGGTVRVFAEAGTYAPSTLYTILTANDVVGTFDDVTSNFAFLSPTLSYDTNNVFLTLDLVAAFQDAARTPNQFNVAGAADALGGGNDIYDEILVMTEDEARAAFDALSGETHASAKTAFFHSAQQIREALLARLRTLFGGGTQTAALAYVPAAGDEMRDGSGSVVWGHVFGSWGETDSNGNAADLDRSAAGILGGADKALGENSRIGLALGYSRSTFDVDARRSSGESDNFHIAGYAGMKLGAADLKGTLAYSYQQAETTRTVVVGGLTNRLSADYDAHTLQAAAEIGTDLARGSAVFTPFAGLAVVHVETEGFTERGGPAALTVAGDGHTTGISTLGLRARRESENVALHGALAWRHAFGDVDPSARAAFASAPAGTFTVQGAPISKDALAFEAGIDMKLGARTVLTLGYAGEYGTDAQDHGLKAELAIRF
ncbi:MAG: autotransporter domain-containing protein [Parvibaculum sp.]|uniref:autotransporter domain-containing protein n=1 Tax=Parvibaculum sp. TaxID=2024848 RepID=UPI0027289BC8|nr:autotransporter domain-containing protein [Parvibaculum sp.]MDO8837900.1 autotransporter domain-containing protein [Parvibaculum sp.]